MKAKRKLHVLEPSDVAGVTMSAQSIRLARFGRGLALTGIVAGFGVLAYFCSSQVRFASVVPLIIPPVPVTIDRWAWATGALLLVLSYVIFAWAMMQISGLLLAISQGDMLGPRVERALQRLSYAAGISVIGSIVGRTLFGLAVSFANPTGQQQLLVQFSSNDLLMGLAAIFLFLFARIIGEVRRVDQENRGFV
jgi:hypothetical protein